MIKSTKEQKKKVPFKIRIGQNAVMLMCIRRLCCFIIGNKGLT